MGRRGELDQLMADALRADAADSRSVGFDGGECFLLDVEIQLRREPDGAQQAQVVLRKSLFRDADRADYPVAQVRFAANPIVRAFRHWTLKHTVPHDITTQDVPPRIPAASTSPV